jgi:hypothetical protein
MDSGMSLKAAAAKVGVAATLAEFYGRDGESEAAGEIPDTSNSANS